jgi:tetratricopeptide (TPR) repeat protein
MRSGAKQHARAVRLAGLMGLLLFGVAARAEAKRTPQAKPSDAGLAKNLSMAESQHEIVMILLKKKEFTQAAAEADKIFQMDWPPKEEPRLLQELIGLSGQFLKYEQPALALQLLEKNGPSFKALRSQVAVWKERGYLLKSMGQDDRALECFRKAQELEKKAPD